MKIKLLAIAPEDGWAFYSQAEESETGEDKVYLLRPPYTKEGLVQVSTDIVEKAIFQHGFEACEDLSFDNMADLIAYVERRFVEIEEARGKALPSPEELRGLLEFATADVIDMFLTRTEQELIPQKAFVAARAIATDLLRLDRVKQNAGMRKRAWNILDTCRRQADSHHVLTDEIKNLSDQEDTKLATLTKARYARFEPRSLQMWGGRSTVAIALVFTDVVASTELRNELGNETMSEARRAHYERARGLITDCDGYEIKTIDGSFMVAFRTAVDALDFALDLHDDTGHPQVAIRAGIHVGVVEIENEHALAVMVNFASRVEGIGKGTEIWVSGDAKSHIDYENATRHKSLLWIKHPDYKLKGSAGTHTLWSVVRSE